MAEINVTPLVDVMLVLLIIFMVTAPLLVAGVPITLPDSRAKALDQADKPVQLSMDATGALFLDDAQISRADLPRLDRDSLPSLRRLSRRHGRRKARWTGP
jgi:biopolymer transport protein TolR